MSDELLLLILLRLLLLELELELLESELLLRLLLLDTRGEISLVGEGSLCNLLSIGSNLAPVF